MSRETEKDEATHVFDIDLGCPTHFTIADPLCGACVARQHPEVRDRINALLPVVASEGARAEGSDVDFAAARREAEKIVNLVAKLEEAGAVSSFAHQSVSLARAYLALARVSSQTGTNAGLTHSGPCKACGQTIPAAPTPSREATEPVAWVAQHTDGQIWWDSRRGTKAQVERYINHPAFTDAAASIHLKAEPLFTHPSAPREPSAAMVEAAIEAHQEYADGNLHDLGPYGAMREALRAALSVEGA